MGDHYPEPSDCSLSAVRHGNLSKNKCSSRSDFGPHVMLFTSASSLNSDSGQPESDSRPEIINTQRVVAYGAPDHKLAKAWRIGFRSSYTNLCDSRSVDLETLLGICLLDTQCNLTWHFYFIISVAVLAPPGLASPALSKARARTRCRFPGL